MTRSRLVPVLAGVLGGMVLLLAIPEPALAWGAPTHVYIGGEILNMVGGLGPNVAAVLSAFPGDFLYGSLAPDFPVAKKRAPAGRHSHYWSVGWEILRAAGGDPRHQSAALGYLAHLSADVVAHGLFVPRMLLLTSSTRSIGHSYWEHRMDASLGSEHAETVSELVAEYEGSSTDQLFRETTARTLFDFDTNRRVFRELVRWTRHEGWQALFGTMVENSRWALGETRRRRYLDLSVAATYDLLKRGPAAAAAEGDPIADPAFEEAKRIRRRILREHGWLRKDALQEAADLHFPLDRVPRRDGVPAGPEARRERPETAAGEWRAGAPAA